MKLTDTEKAMLEGEYGKAVSMAMSILIKLGRAYDAEEMIQISQVHVDACSFEPPRLIGTANINDIGIDSLSDGGLEFLEKLANSGAKFSVPTTTNITGRDIKLWQELRITPNYAEISRRREQACLQMGALPTWTCAPYLYGIVPHFGEQIVWGESNAIAFVNSVIGARTARHGDFADILAAITGRIPKIGLHIPENRKGKVLLKIEPSNIIDFGNDSMYFSVLGYLVGSIAQERVPVVDGVPSNITSDQMKGFSAAISMAGPIGLFHLVGVTPEASTYESAFQEEDPEQIVNISWEEVLKTRGNLTTGEGNVDLVVIGCPHASFPEVNQLFKILDGRRVRKGVEFWVHTNRTVHYWLEQTGILDSLKASGIRVTTDSCMLGFPLDNWGFQLMVTNSAKLAHYAPTLGIKAFLGNIGECVEAALNGEVRNYLKSSEHGPRN